MLFAVSDKIPTLTDLRARGPKQQPHYEDAAELQRTVDSLQSRPPLVFAGEVDELRDGLAKVARGEGFLLQGGDCAETFAGVTADNLKNKLQTLLAMSLVLTYAGQVPVLKVGRIAGQYAKPRSKDTETRTIDGTEVTLPSFRGDAVNGFEFTAEARRNDPSRLLEVYNASAATLNLTRAFVGGGFADLRSVNTWNSDFVRSANGAADRYQDLLAEIEAALAFMVACGIDDEQMRSVDFYSSHEALLLEYEHALTRIDSRSQEPYGTSGHFLWIGERTRDLDGAHVELLRHVRNPLGVKLGPTATAQDAIALADRLDPDRIPGRITFITRMGAGKVRDVLPAIIEGVEATGREVVWVCDPMHGNTYTSSSGYKTRSFTDVVEEVTGWFDVHEQLGTWPGGVHVELTGEDVTECVGGSIDLAEDDLIHRYETACDPRLNRSQSLELAFTVAERLRQGLAGRSNPVQHFHAREF